jgi:hypothetical protein
MRHEYLKNNNDFKQYGHGPAINAPNHVIYDT